MPDHFIRLRGPWQCEPRARTLRQPDGSIIDLPGSVPVPRTMPIPCRWDRQGLGPFHGRVRFSRHFHWPAGLDYFERLWLRFLGVDYFARVWLNGQFLGEHTGAFDPFEFDVSRLVAPRNELIVDVDLPAEENDRPSLLRASSACPPGSGGIWGEVLLEVRRQSFIRNLFAWTELPAGVPEVHRRFQPWAETPQQVELYVLFDGQTILYETIEAGPQAATLERRFQAAKADVWQPRNLGQPALHEVRLELVDVGSRLDAQTRTVGFRQVENLGKNGETRVNGSIIQPCRVDLLEPVADAPWLDDADQRGEALSLRLPVPANFSRGPEAQSEADRQIRAIRAWLGHHPCIVEWRGGEACAREAVFH